MVSAGLQPNQTTYSALIAAYEKGEQCAKAEAALEAMRAASLAPNVFTYNSLLNLMWGCGRRGRALELLRQVGGAKASCVGRAAERRHPTGLRA